MLPNGDLADSPVLNGSLFRRSRLALSADQKHLYHFTEPSKGTTPEKYEIDGETIRKVREDGFGNERWPPFHSLFLSPGEQHLYYGDVQTEADDLARVSGVVTEPIWAGDAAGTFAASSTTIYDAQTLAPLAKLPSSAMGVALLAGDRNLWYADDGGVLRFVGIDDALAGAPLGLRERAVLPLDKYSFTRLVAAPNGQSLYALDPYKGVVVDISVASKQPTASLYVGPTPRDLFALPWGRANLCRPRDCPSDFGSGCRLVLL